MVKIFTLFLTFVFFETLCSPTRTITFYRKDKPYYELTNFWMAPIYLDDKIWPSTEHYFQAQKFTNQRIQEKIRTLKTCMQTFYFVRDPKLWNLVRNDWHSGFKDVVMLKALRAKFAQHAYLKKILLDTGDALLIEDSNNDYYWGDPHSYDPHLNTGRNQLGLLLMQVRAELQSQKNV